MQLTPRLTSACGSAWVATTRLSLTPTMTPQPVPQKRHGAFDHLTPGGVGGRLCIGRHGNAGGDAGRRRGGVPQELAPKHLHGISSFMASRLSAHW